MEISPKERQEMLQSIDESIEKAEESTNFEIKRAFIRDVVGKIEIVEKSAVKKEATLYDRLMNGEFNHEAREKFIDICEQVTIEMGFPDLSPLHKAIANYIIANGDDLKEEYKVRYGITK
ncbi:MAG: hypothetical protein IJU76_14150 [Desulfovibrionaceae bacterium]|nr:hypothetical protein [Desulfovibrionaceae bacterium]